jgi:hypothetical protein
MKESEKVVVEHRIVDWPFGDHCEPWVTDQAQESKGPGTQPE